MVNRKSQSVWVTVLLLGGLVLASSATAADLFYGGQHYKFHRKGLMPAHRHFVPRRTRRHRRLVPAHEYVAPPLVEQHRHRLDKVNAPHPTLVGSRCKSVSAAIRAVKRNYPGSRVLHTRYGKRYGQIVYVVVKIVTRDGRVTTVKVNLC